MKVNSKIRYESNPHLHGNIRKAYFPLNYFLKQIMKINT